MSEITLTTKEMREYAGPKYRIFAQLHDYEYKNGFELRLKSDRTKSAPIPANPTKSDIDNAIRNLHGSTN